MLKHSKQREAILTYLLSTRSHPTADTVYENVRAVLPNISLATVYRNLNVLADQGEILRLSCGEGGEHYDGFTHKHNHFYCRSCKSVLDLSLPSLEEIDAMAAADFAGAIEGHKLFFYGLCQNCLKKEPSA